MSQRRDADITAPSQPPSSGKRKDVPATQIMGTRSSAIATKGTQDPPSKKRKASSSTPATHHSSGAISNEVDTTAPETPPRYLSYLDLTADWHTTLPVSCSPTTFQITHHTGDIFSAPPHTLLIHACNTRGVWGAGIALAFKKRYPSAYTAHRAFCRTNDVPVGTAQLLHAGEHWTGCLFTSKAYGKKKDTPDAILKNTGAAMQMLMELVKVQGDGVGEVRTCRINSGKFGVEWERTERVLQGTEVQKGWRNKVGVWVPEE
jgi:ADP-ribose 1''-phosphate phosphatase